MPALVLSSKGMENAVWNMPYSTFPSKSHQINIYFSSPGKEPQLRHLNLILRKLHRTFCYQDRSLCFSLFTDPYQCSTDHPQLLTLVQTSTLLLFSELDPYQADADLFPFFPHRNKNILWRRNGYISAQYLVIYYLLTDQ